MNRQQRIAFVNDLLFELICAGGGDGDTLAAYAAKIVDTLDGLPTAPMVRTNDRETSQAAAAKVELNISHTRRKVLEHAARYDDRGITDDELKRLFPTAPESTYRKRRSELTAFGYLEDSGMKRPNRAKNDEIVWRITDKGRKAL